MVCPVYRASGGKEFYSARGKKHLLEQFDGTVPSPVFEDIFSKCLLCGACTIACPRGVNVGQEVKGARSAFSPFYGEHGYAQYLARKILNRPELLGVVSGVGRNLAHLLAKRLPADSGLRLRLALFGEHRLEQQAALPCSEPVPATGKRLLYFPGCGAHHLYPEIIRSCRALLARFDYWLEIPDGLGCCGLASESAGDFANSQRLARRNIAALEDSEGPILVSCGACFAHLLGYVDLFAEDGGWRQRAENVCGRLVEMSRFLDAQVLGEGRKSAAARQGPRLRIFYHDPCHLRHQLDITREPRNILGRLSGVELVELADGPQCCGQGGLFHLGAPELSVAIRDDLAEKVWALNPDVIASSCSSCLMQWKTAAAAASRRLPVMHLAQLLNHVMAAPLA